MDGDHHLELYAAYDQLRTRCLYCRRLSRPQHKAGLKRKYQTCSRFEIAIFIGFALKSRFDFPVSNLLFGIKPAYDEACLQSCTSELSSEAKAHPRQGSCSPDLSNHGLPAPLRQLLFLPSLLLLPFPVPHLSLPLPFAFAFAAAAFAAYQAFRSGSPPRLA